MAVACAADELPILKEENSISGSYQDMTTSAPDTSVSSAFVETSNYMPSRLASSVGTAHFKAMQIGLEMRSAVNKFKQSESSCRVVNSNKGSYIMPTVY